MDPIIKKGIVLSLPIFAGYLFLGSTFGIMLVESGYPFWLAPIMSLFIYAGSGQIAAVGLMVLDFDLINAFIITVIINVFRTKVRKMRVPVYYFKEKNQ